MSKAKRQGKRGHGSVPREYERIRSRYRLEPPPVQTRAVVCSVCGRRRNVPLDTAIEDYVCMACREQEAEESLSVGIAGAREREKSRFPEQEGR